MLRSRWRERLADGLGLLAITLVSLDYLRPSLLLLPTIAAGGDTPCHYPTAVWFYERLLPSLRFHGWYPGAYLGQPLLLYYFPLPFLLMAALAPLLGMPVAFKLGTVAGAFLLPLVSYVSLRLLGLRFPGPLLGAAAALVFLFLEDNPIWGGTLASALTGEFAYSYGIALGVLFLGTVYRAHSRREGPWVPGAALAATALAHGYAVLWAGLSACYFLYGTRRPLRTLAWLLGIAGLAFALAAFSLVPLLADWGWTTPYADPWITVSTKGLFPPLLWPLFGLAGAGLLITLVRARRRGHDERPLFLIHSALVAAALAAAGPALGVVDVRFVPFAQLALCLAGAATLGWLIQGLLAADLAALGLVILAALYGDQRSRVLRYWIDWNYTGLEAKELWLPFRELAERLRGGVADPRVGVEYSPVHERAGSIRMYETLPFFSGRSTLEGVYNQAGLSTHAVYYLASELFARSPNPFRSRTYSRFDPASALERLPLFNVSQIVALSPALTSFLDSRQDVARIARIPPYTVFRLKDPGPGYVEPLAFAPVRSSPRGWRDKAYRWYTRKPANRALLVFSDERRFRLAERDEWLPPPEQPLPGGVEVRARLEAESIEITTSRPGHPLLVKVSYHPRWRAEGADGPYLVSPSLMLVVPRGRHVRLVYTARAGSDWLGLLLTLGGLGLLAGAAWRASSAGPGAAPAREPPSEDAWPSGRRWGGLIPGALLVLLASARWLPAKGPAGDLDLFYERASRAYAEQRFLDAAEYARHAAGLTGSSSWRAELLCLRGESLLRAGYPRQAVEAFEDVIQGPPGDPHMAQALFGSALAREAAGDKAGADADRQRLRERFAGTPWARRLAAEGGAGERSSSGKGRPFASLRAGPRRGAAGAAPPP